MSTLTKRLVALAGAVTLVGALGACTGSTAEPEAEEAADTSAESESSAGSDEVSGKIAFLMPDLASTRYEEQDAPLFTAAVADLCPNCEVLYQNADADAAAQQAQADSAITQGAEVIVISSVDTAAAASIVESAQSQGVAVVTYDRPITTKPADYYISFDNYWIGENIGKSLIEKLEADGAAPADGGILVVGGSPTDDAAGLIFDGQKAAVDASNYSVLEEFRTPEWDPAKAQDWVAGQITQYGDQILGVIAANDGTGGGSIAALKAAGVSPLPPVTGNDAEIAAIQRVVSGDQYNTISKPISIVATAAAETAVAILSGNTPEPETTLFDTPSKLFVPTVVTQENVKEAIFDAGIYTAAEVCTEEYADACAALGIE
jgi:ABC-type xylose transport system substrate-binding protein